MRPHTRAEAAAVLDTVHDWQEVFLRVLGRRLAHAADEYIELDQVVACEQFVDALLTRLTRTDG